MRREAPSPWLSKGFLSNYPLILVTSEFIKNVDEDAVMPKNVPLRMTGPALGGEGIHLPTASRTIQMKGAHEPNSAPPAGPSQSLELSSLAFAPKVEFSESL